jgi:molybdenum cofactor biosynthesis enzyme MoaA
MYPEILKVLAFVKKIDFSKIWITTNGIKLIDIKFLIKLYKLGVNVIEFSIHANSIELEKEITLRKGENLIKREQ